VILTKITYYYSKKESDFLAHDFVYDHPWRNEGFGTRYNQYCTLEELKEWNNKLYNLILNFGIMFDDNWFYFRTKRGKKFLGYVKRCPLWLSQKKVQCERPRDPFQTNLVKFNG
jgi:hypothetical protein